MSAAIDPFITEDPDTHTISAKLAQWYGAHAPIRRLWAVENDLGLTVCISLEPTSDGSDSLPLWLAMSQKWRSELQSICRRNIELQVAEPDEFPLLHRSGEGVFVAEIDWRESWIHA